MRSVNWDIFPLQWFSVNQESTFKELLSCIVSSFVMLLGWNIGRESYCQYYIFLIASITQTLIGIKYYGSWISMLKMEHKANKIVCVHVHKHVWFSGACLIETGRQIKQNGLSNLKLSSSYWEYLFFKKIFFYLLILPVALFPLKKLYLCYWFAGEDSLWKYAGSF